MNICHFADEAVYVRDIFTSTHCSSYHQCKIYWAIELIYKFKRFIALWIFHFFRLFFILTAIHWKLKRNMLTFSDFSDLVLVRISQIENLSSIAQSVRDIPYSIHGFISFQ